MSARHIDLLSALVARAGHILTKDELISVAWSDVAVTDNSLEQAISSLRRTLGAALIETQPRRGYRFVADVTKTDYRETDAALDALLAPHRAWIEGRAALETLEAGRIQHAREVFEGVLAVAPDQAAAHVGLANACVFAFETTRADASPDRRALAEAETHAREACRLDPGYGEAWATLGFVLERTGNHADARAALRRATTLEPDNYRHHLRLAYSSWGEERLRASSRTCALVPDFPMAHWLASTVHVGRQAFSEAERELAAGLAVQEKQASSASRFGAVALHWLSGLLHLARDEDEPALACFERELANEPQALLYTRECCANTHYAIGALHLRRGRHELAAAAFERTVARMGAHPLARIALAHLQGGVRLRSISSQLSTPVTSAPVDAALCRAVALTLAGRFLEGAGLVEDALDAAPPGHAGWVLPVEPLLNVQARSDDWSGALMRLRARAT